jgi:hypothetical protein
MKLIEHDDKFLCIAHLDAMLDEPELVRALRFGYAETLMIGGECRADDQQAELTAELVLFFDLASSAIRIDEGGTA